MPNAKEVVKSRINQLFFEALRLSDKGLVAFLCFSYGVLGVNAVESSVKAIEDHLRELQKEENNGSPS